METMYEKPRGEVLRQPTRPFFPPDFIASFNSVRDEHGTHTLYKFRLVLPTGEASGSPISRSRRW